MTQQEKKPDRYRDDNDDDDDLRYSFALHTISYLFLSIFVFSHDSSFSYLFYREELFTIHIESKLDFDLLNQLQKENAEIKMIQPVGEIAPY